MFAQRIGAADRAVVAKQDDVAGSSLDRQAGPNELRLPAFVIVVEVNERGLDSAVFCGLHEIEMRAILLARRVTQQRQCLAILVSAAADRRDPLVEGDDCRVLDQPVDRRAV